jgi:hypothetical protein
MNIFIPLWMCPNWEVTDVLKISLIIVQPLAEMWYNGREVIQRWCTVKPTMMTNELRWAEVHRLSLSRT